MRRRRGLPGGIGGEEKRNRLELGIGGVGWRGVGEEIGQRKQDRTSRDRSSI